MGNSNELQAQPDRRGERIAEILAAALHEFFEQGFAAARLDAIAERAGIGKGTIYLYFDSKETLFEEAVRSMILPILERAQGIASAPQGAAADVLRTLLTTFYREVIATERRRILRLLIGEGPRFPRLLEFYHREVISKGIGVIRQVLAYGVARGEFRVTAAVDYPQTVVGSALTGAIWKMLFDNLEPLDVDRLCEAHIDLLLNGLLISKA